MSHVRQALCDHKKVLLARTTEPWLCVCSIHNILVLAPPTASYNFAAPVDARFFSGTHSLPARLLRGYSGSPLVWQSGPVANSAFNRKQRVFSVIPRPSGPSVLPLATAVPSKISPSAEACAHLVPRVILDYQGTALTNESRPRAKSLQKLAAL